MAGAVAGGMGAGPHLLRQTPLTFERVEQAARASDRRGFCSCRDTHAFHDRRHMVLRRFWRDAQAAGDLRIAESLDEQREHLRLPAGEPRRVGAGLADRAARDRARTARPHLTTQLCRSGYRSDLIEQCERLTLCGLVARRERDGLLIRAAELGPGVRRIAPCTFEVSLIRWTQSAHDVGW